MKDLEIAASLVEFFDHVAFQAVPFFHVVQPEGVELQVRVDDEEDLMAVFISYQKRKIEFSHPLVIRDAITAQVVELDIEVHVPTDREWESTSLLFRTFTPQAWYEVDLFWLREPQPPSRSDNFGGA